MGKRKSSKKVQGPKKREPLATTFQCLFCNHEKSVNVKLDRKTGVGALSCKVCGQTYQTTINYLSAAVDVYADWVDACDAVAKEAAAADTTAGPGYKSRDMRPTAAVGPESYGKEDDFVVADDMDAEGEFADDE